MRPLPVSRPAPDPRPATRSRRRAAALLATTALGATALTSLGAAPASAGPTAAAARSVALFPSDALTVPDARQLTGRRVSLPTAGCGAVTTCGLVERLNQLDGFDLDPRLALDFDGPVRVGDVVASTTVTPAAGGAAVGVDRVVQDSTTHTVYAHPRAQLAPGTTYVLRVSGARGLPAASTRFTTLSATDGLLDLRRQLDSGRAFADAGITDRRLQVDAVVPAAGTTFGYVADQGSKGGLVDVPLPSLVQGTVVFGSYLAPRWLQADRTFRTVPTGTDGPRALRAERLPFVLVLPPGRAPEGGWPTAVFGHGFTRTAGDVLLAAATHSASGVATVATDVVGHGYGPRSRYTYTVDGVTRSVPARGRGVDLDGDGTITSTEGSSTLVTGPTAAVASRDGLRQTALDVMTLVRDLQRGQDVDASYGTDLSGKDVTYFGQSFGGIYGTMVAGADPQVERAVLNVPGGPITEIARLSPAFRLLTTQALQIAGLLNSSDPDKAYFEESLPLRGQPPVLDPAVGALPIQSYLARSTWLTRPGSPETFAPLVRPQHALVQVAFGDQTVPNPTAYTLLQAGHLFGRTSLYRNDKTSTSGSNPHGFLLNPATFPSAFAQGQAQVLRFLRDGVVVDPDGAGDVWEVPIADPLEIRRLNYTSPAFPRG